MEKKAPYMRGFTPYALAAFLIGIVGGFSTVLGPAFVQSIGISYSNTTWTALVQAMSTAACAPILGKLGDVIGRRLTLLIGLLVYTLGNVLTALAGSLAFMMIARFTVGIGTAAMSPVIMGYIVSQFPPDKIAQGFSLYMLISSASVIFGPAAGSLVIAAYGWRAMIWISVAICAVVFGTCLVTSRGDETIRKPIANFDGIGAVFVVIFFSLMLCIPAFGQNFGWASPRFLFVFLLSLAFLTGLILAERKAVNPILPASFLARGPFILSGLTLFLTQGLMQANMTNTIIFVNSTQPGNSVVSGYAISAMYVGMSLGAVLLGPLADRKEPKYVLAGALSLTAIGVAFLFLFSENTPVWILMASLGILGFGLGANGSILMKVALSNIPAQSAGAASGTYSLFRDLAAPFGVAVFVPMFTNRISALESMGILTSAAAIQAVRSLAITEILCIAAGIGIVLNLPKIHKPKEYPNEIEG